MGIEETESFHIECGLGDFFFVWMIYKIMNDSFLHMQHYKLLRHTNFIPAKEFCIRNSFAFLDLKTKKKHENFWFRFS